MRKEEFAKLSEEKKNKLREYMKKHYQKNKEKWDARTNRYRNTKKGKEYLKNYRDQDKIKKRYKLWKEKNKDHVNEWQRNYRKKTKHKI